MCDSFICLLASKVVPKEQIFTRNSLGLDTVFLSYECRPYLRSNSFLPFPSGGMSSTAQAAAISAGTVVLVSAILALAIIIRRNGPREGGPKYIIRDLKDFKPTYPKISEAQLEMADDASFQTGENGASSTVRVELG
jgi:hypothetical protein